MHTFSIKASLKRGWELFKGNKKVLILSTIIFFIVNSWQNNESARHNWEPVEFIIGVAFFIISFIVQIGWTKSLLKIEAGEKSSVKELFLHSELFVKYVITSFIYGIGTVIGMILLVVPGIYFALRYCFAPVLLVDTGRSIGGSFKESARMTEGIKWKLLGFFIILGLLNILGMLLLVVGLLVSVPVTTLAYIHVYRHLKTKHQ